MRLPAVLPNEFLRCMSAADRKTLAGGQLTREEAISRASVRSEKELQAQLVGLLRLRSIEPLWFRTDKRTRATIGWPDITFAVNGQAMAWEVKMQGEQPRPEQLTMHRLMRRTGWTVEIVRSVDEGIAILNGAGTTPAL